MKAVSIAIFFVGVLLLRAGHRPVAVDWEHDVTDVIFAVAFGFVIGRAISKELVR